MSLLLESLAFTWGVSILRTDDKLWRAHDKLMLCVCDILLDKQSRVGYMMQLMMHDGLTFEVSKSETYEASQEAHGKDASLPSVRILIPLSQQYPQAN